MALPNGAQTFAGRLATFEAVHHMPKRRASNNKKKGPSTLTWPTTAPTAEDMARAGFFYKPQATNPDNVMCFVCQRQLDGWEPGDNPAFEHFTHSRDCGWAINVSIAQRNGDANRVDEDPMHDRLVQARKATFLGSWPHEHKKGWKCKTQKMVEAGWCYDPSPEYDDGVTCFYCNLSLDGWEPKDNPLDEHQKRSPDCPFFDLVEQHAATREPKKGKKGRGSAASKASRLSTQSNLTVMTDAPSMTSLGEGPAGEDDSVLTTATTASKATKGRKGAGRAKAAAKGAKRGTRSKKTSTATVEEAQPQTMDLDLEEPDAEATPEPPKRATRRNTKQDSSLVDVTTASAAPSQTRKTTRTKASKAKAEERLSDDQSQLQEEFRAALEASKMPLNSREGTPKATRGTKRTSDGVPKLDSSVVILDAPPEHLEYLWSPGKAEKGKSPNAYVLSKVQLQSQPDQEPQDLPATKTTGRLRANSKAKRGKKKAAEEVSTVVEPEELPEEELLQPEEMTLDPSPAPAPATKQTPSPQKDSSASPPPPTPTPARIAPSSVHRSSPILPRISNIAKQPERTPSASPQSSDAENRPPPSHPPKSARQPLASASSNRQTTRIPLAASTPTASPSKRNVLAGLISSLPWTAADLETVFAPSPTSKAGRSSGFGFGSASALTEQDKENQTILDKLAADLQSPEKGRLALEEVVKKVKEALTSPEKKMSVEEWVKYNAQRGEEKLRGECERLRLASRDR
ncbi:hypothetical protein NA57DRAFT_55462 [Rhizodiscina lignyota]|uniref:BIR-domain-containing protein n=1 Tax=Rhizodiscina lignyota TaxID=1504668 RepID=A0A9P4IJ86_9PEZI|nr:hypothetical protein NA57DRAFT_55462 [Rhizodiscina lignyota]